MCQWYSKCLSNSHRCMSTNSANIFYLDNDTTEIEDVLKKELQMYATDLLRINHQFVLAKIELNVLFQWANKNVPEINVEFDNNRIKQYIW